MVLVSGCAALRGTASLTFRVDSMECGPAKAAGSIGTVCSFFAYYGNVGGHSIQVQPNTTMVLDRTGRTFAPVAEAQTGASFLLKPGLQHQIAWSVTLPANTKPAKVTWHGSKVPVEFDSSSPTASAQPSASAGPASVAPSASASASAVVPTSAVPQTTPPPTTTKPVVKPTKTKPKVTVKPTVPKPTRTTVKPTTVPPTTPRPPVTTTTHRPVHTHTAPPTVGNSTNPGGGSGSIG